MEFWIYFGIYTFSMIVIWSFFIIAKIHSFKFKNYQPKIIGITRAVNILMIILILLGYIYIFSYSGGRDTYTLEKSSSEKSNIENEIGDFNDISNKNDIIIDNVGDDYY